MLYFKRTFLLQALYFATIVKSKPSCTAKNLFRLLLSIKSHFRRFEFNSKVVFLKQEDKIKNETETRIVCLGGGLQHRRLFGNTARKLGGASLGLL
jgi:hypothetical protein